MIVDLGTKYGRDRDGTPVEGVYNATPTSVTSWGKEGVTIKMPELEPSQYVLAVVEEFEGGWDQGTYQTTGRLESTYLCSDLDDIRQLYRRRHDSEHPEALRWYSGQLSEQLLEIARIPHLVATRNVDGFAPQLNEGLLPDNSEDTRREIVSKFERRDVMFANQMIGIMPASEFGIVMVSKLDPNDRNPVPEDSWIAVTKHSF